MYVCVWEEGGGSELAVLLPFTAGSGPSLRFFCYKLLRIIAKDWLCQCRLSPPWKSRSARPFVLLPFFPFFSPPPPVPTTVVFCQLVVKMPASLKRAQTNNICLVCTDALGSLLSLVIPSSTPLNVCNYGYSHNARNIRTIFRCLKPSSFFIWFHTQGLIGSTEYSGETWIKCAISLAVPLNPWHSLLSSTLLGMQKCRIPWKEGLYGLFPGASNVEPLLTFTN